MRPITKLDDSYSSPESLLSYPVYKKYVKLMVVTPKNARNG